MKNKKKACREFIAKLDKACAQLPQEEFLTFTATKPNPCFNPDKDADFPLFMLNFFSKTALGRKVLERMGEPWE